MRLPRLSSAVGAGFLVWGLAVGLIRLHDNSFLTEVATGRLILTSGFPHGDPYSFTAHGHPWVLQSWLAEVLYGWVDRIDGAHGLQLLHAALAVVLTALVWRLTRPAKALVGRILAAAAVLAIGTGYWSPRPLLVALILLALLVALVEAPRASPWLAAPVLWVWVQVHGSWPLGLAYLVIRMIGRHFDRQPLERLPGLLGAATAGVLLGAVNPYGFRLLAYPLVVITHHQSFAHIVEWQSPPFSDPVNAVFLAEALLTLLLAGLRHGTLEDGLITVLFVAGACLASRNVPVAALVILPVLARGLAGLGEIEGDRRSPAAVAVIVVMALAGVVLVGSALRSPEFQLAAYPTNAVTWMQGHGMAPGRVATQDFVGNYLEYRFGARAEAFVDDRVDMYPTSVERAYGTLLSGSRGWQSVLDRYRVSTVLWDRNLALAGLVEEDPNWRTVYLDRHWLVAMRRR